MKRKIFAFIISVCMLISCFCITTNAASISGTCGVQLTWTFDTETNQLSIDGVGNMTDWTTPKSVPWSEYTELIESVQFSNALTSIGAYTLADCISLTSIYIPAKVKTIGTYALSNCSKLNSIDVSLENEYFSSVDGVLFTKSMKELLYYPQDKIESSYEIPQGVSKISKSAFNKANNLTDIKTPDSITTIQSFAFYCCQNLRTINLSKNLTYIGLNAFQYCTRLRNITIPDGVETICNSTFSNCTNLKNVNLPSTLKYIESNAFFDCTKLSSIILPDTLVSIGEKAFCKCRALNSIVIPELISKINKYTFMECESLANITFKNQKIVLDYFSFVGTTCIERIILNSCDIVIDKNAFIIPEEEVEAREENGIYSPEFLPELIFVDNVEHVYNEHIFEALPFVTDIYFMNPTNVNIDPSIISSDTVIHAYCTTESDETIEGYSPYEYAIIYNNEFESLGHNMSDWITITKLTSSSIGLRERKCSICDMVESEEILEDEAILYSDDIQINVDDKILIKPVIIPNNISYTDVTYISNDTSIAIIDQNGIVTGVGVGTTTIRIVSNKNPNLMTTIIITVGSKPTTEIESISETTNNETNIIETTTTSINSNINSFRCSMCDSYEAQKDKPIVGAIITFIHFFIHMFSSIGK